MSYPTINGVVDPKTPDGLLTLFEGASCTLAYLQAAEDEGHQIRSEVWLRAQEEHRRLRSIILMKLEGPARLP